MDTRPEIDMDKYKNMMGNEQQQEENEPPARFCNSECRQSYREDRLSGVPLPRHDVGGQSLSHKTMCAQMNLCACCLNKLDN